MCIICVSIVYIIVPVVEVDSFTDTNITIAHPVVTRGYNCTPLIPFGEVNRMGELVIPAGADTTIDGEYTCMSPDMNGSFIINLKAVGK